MAAQCFFSKLSFSFPYFVIELKLSSLEFSSPWKFMMLGLFERPFKMMNNDVYFIVIALLVAKLFKILVYAN